MHFHFIERKLKYGNNTECQIAVFGYSADFDHVEKEGNCEPESFFGQTPLTTPYENLA